MDIEECANNSIPNEELNPKMIEAVNGYPNEGNEQKQEFWLWKMLKAETGEGTIGSYNNHPLNKDIDKNVSQILRGCTGMLGNLNYAVLDIILGSFGLVKDKNIVQDINYEDTEYTKSNPNNGRPSVVNGQHV